MSPLRLRERLGYALSANGATATLWWLLRKLARLEPYHVFELNKRRSVGTAKELPSFAFERVARVIDVKSLAFNIRSQLEDHCAQDLDRLLSERRILYFLADRESVVCQLIISPGNRITLDAPAGLWLDIGSESSFLSYLFTHSGYRRIGAAKKLIHLVAEDLARRGVTRVLAHVSATNVPSLSTFHDAGWKKIGTFVANKHARVLFVMGLSQHHVKVQPDANSPFNPD